MTLDWQWIIRHDTKSTSKNRQKNQINWTSSKLKTLCIKGHYQENEKTPTEWEKRSANHISDESLVLSRTYRELFLLNNKKRI